jgi:hypothetical protein
MPIKYQSEEILHPFLFFLKKKKKWEKNIEKENENERKGDLWVWRFIHSPQFTRIDADVSEP